MCRTTLCLRDIVLMSIVFYRIDGTLVNITVHVGEKMKLYNGTVVMDIQKSFSSELDESGVVLISLQFESGLLRSFKLEHFFSSLVSTGFFKSQS